MATATVTRRAPAPARLPQASQPRLEVVGPPGRHRFRWSGRHAVALAVTLVLGSLLLVAGTQAYMTQQQVRLGTMEARLAVQSASHRNLELQVAQLSNPSHVVSAAQRQGLVVPSQVTDLPPVSPPASTTHRGSRSSLAKGSTPPPPAVGAQASGGGHR
jgi:cell division protein FtsB